MSAERELSERAKGIEPFSQVWKTWAQPVYQARSSGVLEENRTPIAGFTDQRLNH
jgi:hypothetical protein